MQAHGGLIQVSKTCEVLMRNWRLWSVSAHTAAMARIARRAWSRVKQQGTASLQQRLHEVHSMQLDGQQEVLMQWLDAVQKQDKHIVIPSLNCHGEASS
jgi:hypothetical protein